MNAGRARPPGLGELWSVEIQARRLQSECALSHSRRAEFTFVCQPRPRLLKARTMSASSLMFTCCFGVSSTGRPRFGFSIAAAASAPTSLESSSDAGCALLNHASSSSGESSSTSSGLGLRGIFGPFTIVGPSKTDHMQSWRPWREYQHVKLVAYEAQGLESLLSVVFSCVLANERRAPLKAECKTKRNTSLGYVSCVLGRIESYKHVIYCTHINARTASAAPKTPNPSFKPSPNGGPPGPVWRYAVHFRQPGPGVPPSVPA